MPPFGRKLRLDGAACLHEHSRVVRWVPNDYLMGMTEAAQVFAGIKSDFEILEDWEDRYRHIIELGKALPAFDERYRDAAHKVSGCASQVWIHFDRAPSPEGARLDLTGDSDALIVKGLMAILFALFSGRTAREIASFDALAALAELDLSSHLTQQRSNGLASMVARIKAEARAVLAEQSPAGNQPAPSA
ncbi:MAG: SufE family protein [Aestuariivirga sp.]